MTLINPTGSFLARVPPKLREGAGVKDGAYETEPISIYSIYNSI